jgi:predicted DNA-binding transcriptional regulator YafY
MALMNKSERIIFLIKLFLKQRQVTIEEILVELDNNGDDVSRRSIERDLNLLSTHQLITSNIRESKKKIWESWGYLKRRSYC